MGLYVKIMVLIIIIFATPDTENITYILILTTLFSYTTSLIICCAGMPETESPTTENMCVAECREKCVQSPEPLRCFEKCTKTCYYIHTYIYIQERNPKQTWSSIADRMPVNLH